MPRDPLHMPAVYGPPIEYVPQRLFCGRCGCDLNRPKLKIWWCGHVDRWCCDECQTPEDWKTHDTEDIVVPEADVGSANGLSP